MMLARLGGAGGEGDAQTNVSRGSRIMSLRRKRERAAREKWRRALNYARARMDNLGALAT